MSQKAIATQFRQDPGPVLLDVIRGFGKPVGKGDVVSALVATSLAEKTVASAWTRLLPFLKDHPNVRVVRSRSYEWVSEQIGAAEALARMRRVHRLRTPSWLLDALADVVTSGLGTTTEVPPPTTAVEDDTLREQAVRAVQERQWKIDVVRAVAELAMAVEEITYKGAEPEGILERVRNHALAHSLMPIGQSGEEAKFDPAVHVPLVGIPEVGSPVVVIRPGYSWHGDVEAVLIERAVVRTV